MGRFILLLSFLAMSACAHVGEADAATLATISVPATKQCTEGGTVLLPVTRSGSFGQTANFRYKTTDGTAKAGVDFVGMSGSQSVRKNASSYTFTIRCTPDNLTYQGNRTFSFTITAGTGSIVANGITAITIIENDAAPPPPPPPTQTCPDGSVISMNLECPAPTSTTCADGSVVHPPEICPALPPPPPPADVTCADGTKLPAGSTCPSMSWILAPLKIGGYARAMTNCTSPHPSSVAGPKANGTYDPIFSSLIAGNVYPVITWGWDAAPVKTNVWAVDLGGGKGAYFPEACVEGVRPSS